MTVRCDRRSRVFAAFAAFLVLTAGPWARQSSPAQTPAPSRVARAEAVLDALLAHDSGKIVAQFDATMKAALTEQALRDGWDKTAAQIGALVKRGAPQEQQRGAYTTV